MQSVVVVVEVVGGFYWLGARTRGGRAIGGRLGEGRLVAVSFL